MKESALCFALKDLIRINGRKYQVEGYIDFLNEADHCNWREYKLLDTEGRMTKWLSIDQVYREYALYTISSNKAEEIITREHYKEVDHGTAKVMDSKGNVDTTYGECVEFTEYEDRTEEKIISIERWEDEIEYSTGYYLDADEIELVTNGNQSFSYAGQNVRAGAGTFGIRSAVKKFSLVFALAIILVICNTLLHVMNSLNIGGVNLSKEIKNSSDFTYVTSITADMDNDQKADVYETELSVEEAAKGVIKLAHKSIKAVDEDTEDGTVAIMTSSHYALVYADEDQKTLVQVSSRRYVYSSRQQPYRSRSHTYDYYRKYYYTVGYKGDSRKYSGTSAYENYSDGGVEINSNNRYQNYSDSIKQESTASRSSSGGGTSSGK